MPSHPADPARSAVRPKEPTAPKLSAALTDATLPRDEFTDDRDYRGLRYKGADLSNLRAEVIDVERCRFVGVSLAGTTLRQAGFTDVELDTCDLSAIRATRSRLTRVRVIGSRLAGADWSECGLQSVVFESCRADLARFRFSTLKEVVFRDCTLREASFQEADLRKVRFEDCDLSGAQLSNAKMTGARLSGCVLAGVGGVASLAGATVHSRDLSTLARSLAGALGMTIEE